MNQDQALKDVQTQFKATTPEQQKALAQVTAAFQPITPDSLSPVKPLSVPQLPPTYNATGITGATDASLESFNTLATRLNSDYSAAQKASRSSERSLEDTMNQILGVQQSRQSVEDSLHVDELGKLNNDAFTALQASKRAQEKEVEAAVNAAGGLKAGAEQAVQAINRRYAFEQADLSIALDVSNRNYLAAQQTADRKIQMQLEPLQTLLDFQKTFYENNKDDLRDAEKNRLQLLITENERRYTEQQDALQTLSKTKLAYLQAAQQNGAPASIINAISMAQTPEDAARAAGQYGVELNTSVVEAGGRKLLINSLTGQTIRDLGSAQNPVNTPSFSLTPEQQNDPFIQTLAASAGGKALTDTSIQQLNKGIGVLGQLGVLQSNIQNTSTGPIIGLFRGANPWDTNAQSIKAQLNAIVPNLARGIYGEVGVLTDNDIKTYSQTIPNLKSTEDVRNAVLGITLDQIAKSIKNTLAVNAAAGRDVSGFIDLYTQMQQTRDSVFAQLSGNVETTKEDEDAFDSVVSGDSGFSLGGFFSDIWKGLTGQ